MIVNGFLFRVFEQMHIICWKPQIDIASSVNVYQICSLSSQFTVEYCHNFRSCLWWVVFEYDFNFNLTGNWCEKWQQKQQKIWKNSRCVLKSLFFFFFFNFFCIFDCNALNTINRCAPTWFCVCHIWFRQI